MQEEFEKIGDYVWFPQSIKPELIVREGTVLGYSTPIIYSNGKVGFYDSRSDRFVVSKEPEDAPNNILWSYFPCASDMKEWARKMSSHTKEKELK